jgi:hypothetical protein
VNADFQRRPRTAVTRRWRTRSIPQVHQLDDPAPMSGNRGLENFPSTGLDGGERTGLVQMHEAAVANRIGGKNGGKPALGAFFGHLARLFLRNAVQQILRLACRGVYQPGLPHGVINGGRGISALRPFMPQQADIGRPGLQVSSVPRANLSIIAHLASRFRTPLNCRFSALRATAIGTDRNYLRECG